MTEKGISPAASGPAGHHFEGAVAAGYLLAMLAGAAPRGLPGKSIDRVEFQRAAEGRPLDDIVVHARDAAGHEAVLEIQVKRSITFAPKDRAFLDVAGQIARAAQREDFQTIRYELAIATAQTSGRISGPIQDTLKWARDLESAATFMARIKRAGSANDKMRDFVETFRSHLRSSGIAGEDETVWQILCRLQIHVYDLTAVGSAFTDLATVQCAAALHPSESQKAGALWSTLIDLAIHRAASGGAYTREELIGELLARGFRLAAERRNAAALEALAEASRLALSDIDDRIGQVSLRRSNLIIAIHAALDRGRYVEIRGAAGTGKSALLKHVAEEMSRQSRIIVFSPNRTVPRGWTSFKADIAFDGTLRELLVELAATGGSTIFVDSLDFFDEDERVTVRDFVQAAAEVPGVSVLATARAEFGTQGTHWLPADALNRLGRAEAILVKDLSDAEAEELGAALPALAHLLADNHPAREVARNPFRLSRLARLTADAHAPPTEAGMARDWWASAGGTPGITPDERARQRERSRDLRSFAAQSIHQTGPLFATELDADSVQALITSGTLRDHGNDRVTFRHDVLREWAIACLLDAEPEFLNRFPLDRIAPPTLARAVELLARFRLETAETVDDWLRLLDRLGIDTVNSSWRRAVLLAIVRSEVGDELLRRAVASLLASDGKLLRDLLRTVMAVEVMPASRVLAAAGFDLAILPSELVVPIGSSWPRLIPWLVEIGNDLLASIIPDVVDLYTTWSLGWLGRDPLTPHLVPWLYRWLAEIEDSHRPFGRRAPFGGRLDYDRIRSLEESLRTSFLLFCNRAPELAVAYLDRLTRSRPNEHVLKSVIMFAGTMPLAAPKSYSDFVADALISASPQRPRRDHYGLARPFDHHNTWFLRPEPTRGPFLALLTNAPEHGLRLVRQLVDHAVAFRSRGKKDDHDSFVISFATGDRAFPCRRSYSWSRTGDGPYCVTAALMALEAWAHKRIESGEPFDKVLPDILGPAGAPAAYLLIVVDLLLSHWPTSREAAIPYLACPELLCIDRARWVHDQWNDQSRLGRARSIQGAQAKGIAENLGDRPSRGLYLDQLFGYYAVFDPPGQRQRLTQLLSAAAVRLGPPSADSDFSDPAFMERHALFRLDPKNWQAVAVEHDGKTSNQWRYVAPEVERQHLKRLHTLSGNGLNDHGMEASLRLALEDPSRSSLDFARAAAEWATGDGAHPESDDPEVVSMRKTAIVTAAMIVMRDGDDDLHSARGAWAQRVFSETLQEKREPVFAIPGTLQSNPAAIAVAGMAFGLRDNARPDAIRALLSGIAHDPMTAPGIHAAAESLAALDERLLRAILRCGLCASIRPRRTGTEPESDADGVAKMVAPAIDAEMDWLAGRRAEPPWPQFPPLVSAERRRHYIGSPPRRKPAPAPSPPDVDLFVHHQAAALWVDATTFHSDGHVRPWAHDLATAYLQWTGRANGTGLSEDEEIANAPFEWSAIYFRLLARCVSSMTPAEVDTTVLNPITELPDDAFFDNIPTFLLSLDRAFFECNEITVDEAVRIRLRLAERLMTSPGWDWQASHQSQGIERGISSAIAALFFNSPLYQPARAYLDPPHIDRLGPFLPTCDAMARAAPCLFTATVFLNLLEVSPRAEHLPFLLAAAGAWLKTLPDDREFWFNHRVGQRFCALIRSSLTAQPDLPGPAPGIRREVDSLVAGLVALGIPDARQLESDILEARLSSGKSDGTAGATPGIPFPRP